MHLRSRCTARRWRRSGGSDCSTNACRPEHVQGQVADVGKSWRRRGHVWGAKVWAHLDSICIRSVEVASAGRDARIGCACDASRCPPVPRLLDSMPQCAPTRHQRARKHILVDVSVVAACSADNVRLGRTDHVVLQSTRTRQASLVPAASTFRHRVVGVRLQIKGCLN